MKIVIAPDSFKGSLSAIQVCDAIERGIRKVDNKAEVIKVPIADGGEGTTESIVYACDGRYINVEVYDPLCRKINARYGIIDGNIAVMEMAEASGLMLLKNNELNPLSASTYGTGQMILSAIENGCRKIYIGIVEHICTFYRRVFQIQ